MKVETGYLKNVDGSCYYETETTKAIASVTGPIEPKSRQELPTQIAIEINIRPAKGVPTTREINIQDKLRSVVTPILASYKYPRQLCQITLQLLQAGESESLFSILELIACVNSTVFALVDSGIAMNSIALGAPLAILQDESIVSNPTDEQLKNSKSSHAVVLQIVDNKPTNVLLMDSYGTFNEMDIFNVLEFAEKNVIESNKEFRDIIKNKISSVQ